MNVNGAEAELLNHWFKELKMTVTEYREPILDTDTVEFIKFACDTLKQDSHVFIMAVDITETYVHVKNLKNEKIYDQLLLINAIIFISSKHAGEQSDLKTRYIDVLYEHVSKKRISSEKVRLAEIDVLQTLDQRLPLYSRIDDLKVFLENYSTLKYLKINISDLCIQILNLVYINYKQLFYKLKSIYYQNVTDFTTFKEISTNRFYIPCGILICALRLTRLQNTFDVNYIIAELSTISFIHKNHIKLLAENIYLLMN